MNILYHSYSAHGCHSRKVVILRGYHLIVKTAPVNNTENLHWDSDTHDVEAGDCIGL